MNEPSVMRGIPVAAAPLRLRREPEPPPAQAALSTPQDAFEAAHQDGYARGAEEGRAQGLQAGHEDGLHAGRREAAAEVEARTQQAVEAATASLRRQQEGLLAVMRRLEGLHGDVLAAAEDELVAMCYDTIVRMVARSAVTPESVRATVAGVAAAMQRHPQVLLRLHPQDAALLDACPPVAVGTPVLTWQADQAVTLGGCVVEAAAGGLDARLETMLSQCRAALLLAREQRRGQVDAGEQP